VQRQILADILVWAEITQEHYDDSTARWGRGAGVPLHLPAAACRCLPRLLLARPALLGAAAAWGGCAPPTPGMHGTAVPQAGSPRRCEAGALTLRPSCPCPALQLCDPAAPGGRRLPADRQRAEGRQAGARLVAAASQHLDE
jgi:hypothetical protein